MRLEHAARQADTHKDMALTKKCSRCGKRRALAEYGPDDRYADGRRPHCMRCRVAYTQAWRVEHREEFNDAKRTYEQRNDVKARRRERDRQRAVRLRRERAQLKKAS
jgi:hypothetical protein